MNYLVGPFFFSFLFIIFSVKAKHRAGFSRGDVNPKMAPVFTGPERRRLLTWDISNLKTRNKMLRL